MLKQNIYRKVISTLSAFDKELQTTTENKKVKLPKGEKLIIDEKNVPKG